MTLSVVCVQVGVVAFSGVADTPSGCYAEELAFATADNKKVMNEYLETVEAAGGTNYVDALETAFDLLKKSPEILSSKKRREYRKSFINLHHRRRLHFVRI